MKAKGQEKPQPISVFAIRRTGNTPDNVNSLDTASFWDGVGWCQQER